MKELLAVAVLAAACYFTFSTGQLLVLFVVFGFAAEKWATYQRDILAVEQQADGIEARMRECEERLFELERPEEG